MKSLLLIHNHSEGVMVVLSHFLFRHSQLNIYAFCRFFKNDITTHSPVVCQHANERHELTFPCVLPEDQFHVVVF